MAFPTFDLAEPLNESYSERASNVGDLVSPMEAGYKISRRQFTRRPKTYKFTLFPIMADERTTINSFINAQGTTGMWDYTLPTAAGGATVTVRFAEIPELVRRDAYWALPMSIEEV